jgi:hypothetical protein
MRSLQSADQAVTPCKGLMTRAAAEREPMVVCDAMRDVVTRKEASPVQTSFFSVGGMYPRLRAAAPAGGEGVLGTRRR